MFVGKKDEGTNYWQKTDERKQDFDFGMPDPHPMDFTRCVHKLTGSVLHKRGPEEVLKKKLKPKLSREARRKFLV